MKHSKITYALSCLLAVCVPCSMTALSVGAVEPDTAQTAAETEEAFVLPDIISPADAEEYGFVGRDYETEKDLNTFVFKNADGSATMKVFSHPVKYADEFGKIKDISLDLVKLPDNSMVTVDNSIKTTFPPSLSDGIAVACEDIDLLMVPVTGNTSPTAVFDDKENKVTYHVDDATDYVYGLTYTGFKEDIMVSEYTGQTDYHFTLYTNGLTLTEEDDTLMLTDEKGEIAAVLSDVIVYTADGGNNTIGSMTYQTVEKNQQYNLTVHLDEAYLSDEATVYPIRIDPSITVNGSSDVHAKCFDSSGGATKLTLNVGRTSLIERSRVCIGFPQLNLSAMHSSLNVTSAKIELYDELQSTTSATIKCYQYDGGWDNTGTSWSSLDLGNDKNIYALLSQKTVSYSNGINLSTPHRYEFNIKPAVEKWVNTQDISSNSSYDVFTPSKGLVFKMLGEGNATIKYKRFANCYSGTNSPSLTISYSYSIPNNEYFSRFEPQKFNTNVINDDSSSLIRYRMNCYGYALGFIYDDAFTFDSYWNEILQGYYWLNFYPQYPGEFVADPSDFQIPSVNEQYTVIMNKLIQNMENDADRWGYTITEYVPTSSVIPQMGTDSRMIALVIGKYDNNTKFDFHYYMQHNDGTWSHKPGNMNISNVSEGDHIILTNENIQIKANQSVYVNNNNPANYQLRFFEITKKPVVDYPHRERGEYFPNTTPTVIRNNYEKGGDSLESATYITIADAYNKLCQIDFAKDDDYFYLIPSSQGQYTINTGYVIDPLSSFMPNMHCEVYNNSGYLLASYTGTGNVSLSTSFSAGNRYIIRIWCSNNYDSAINNNDTNTPFKYYLRIREQ